MLRLEAFDLKKKRLALFTLAILTLSFSSVEGLKAVYKISMPPSLNKSYVPVILHYDSYFYSSPVKMLEKTLQFLISMNFPVEKLSITVWRDVLEKDNLFYDLKSRLEKYGFSWDSYHVGLFLPPEDANDRYILELAMEDYKGRFGNYPFFVAGFAASNDTYLWLEKYGVRISFFNLWEDGQDYSFRGHPCPDRIKGANWEGIGKVLPFNHTNRA